MDNQEISEQVHSELRLLYEVSVADLAFFKRQQWQVTNYCVLIYSAFFGITYLSGANSCGSLNWLAGLTLVVLVVGILLLERLERSMDVRRARLEKIRAQFSSEFNDAWKAKGKDFEHITVSRVSQAVILIGACLYLWIGWYESCVI